MIGRINSLQDAFRRKLKYVHDYPQTEQRPTPQEVRTEDNYMQMSSSAEKRGRP